MQNELLGLIAETSIHAGANASVGVIDLPIMREAHTGWPCVFGSAVKGALRAKAEQQHLADSTIIFGPDRANAADHAGALSVGDARLLLLPVRSLTSHFKWVTCPALLQRAMQDAKRLGKAVPDNLLAWNTGDLKQSDAFIATIDSQKDANLYLEEFHFTTVQRDLNGLLKWLSGFVADDNFSHKLEQQCVIVHDDMFAHLAQFGTPVTPHIAIKNDTKTVAHGALWYEETLPPETVMYIPLIANASRNKEGNSFTAQEMLEKTCSLFPSSAPYLQLGGNETVGMGWCRVSRFKA